MASQGNSLHPKAARALWEILCGTVTADVSAWPAWHSLSSVVHFVSQVGLAKTVYIRVINTVALHYHTQYIRVIYAVLANHMPKHEISVVGSHEESL
jgi:hypothetical protein